ncbi:MAG: hypothetical protein L3J32_04330 [Rhizobiaceae bacterium]|nr:hypothetical protein [Rhizobiaceae bacterium]
MNAHLADYETNISERASICSLNKVSSKYGTLSANPANGETTGINNEEILDGFCPNLLRIREFCNLSVIFTAKYYQIPIHELMSKTRAKAQAAQARQIAIYIAHTTFSVPYREAALYFHRDRTTVAHACRVIEDHRDNRIFDEKLTMVEEFVSEAAVITHWVGYEFARFSTNQSSNGDCYL